MPAQLIVLLVLCLLCLRAHALEDIVLPFDAGYRLLDVGVIRSLQQILCTALLDEIAEHYLVKGMGNRLTLLLWIGQSGEGTEELLSRVDELDRYAELLEDRRDPFGRHPAMDSTGLLMTVLMRRPIMAKMNRRGTTGYPQVL